MGDCGALRRYDPFLKTKVITLLVTLQLLEELTTEIIQLALLALIPSLPNHLVMIILLPMIICLHKEVRGQAKQNVLVL